MLSQQSVTVGPTKFAATIQTNNWLWLFAILLVCAKKSMDIFDVSVVAFVIVGVWIIEEQKIDWPLSVQLCAHIDWN